VLNFFSAALYKIVGLNLAPFSEKVENHSSKQWMLRLCTQASDGFITSQFSHKRIKNYKAMLGNSGKYCPVHKLQDIPDTDKNFINF